MKFLEIYSKEEFIIEKNGVFKLKKGGPFTKYFKNENTLVISDTEEVSNNKTKQNDMKLFHIESVEEIIFTNNQIYSVSFFGAGCLDILGLSILNSFSINISANDTSSITMEGAVFYDSFNSISVITKQDSNIYIKNVKSHFLNINVIDRGEIKLFNSILYKLIIQILGTGKVIGKAVLSTSVEKKTELLEQIIGIDAA